MTNILNIQKSPKAAQDVQTTVWKYIQMLQPKIKDVPYNPDQDLTTVMSGLLSWGQKLF